MKCFKNLIVNMGILITLITSIMGCGADDEMVVMSEEYLPLDVGNSWIFNDGSGGTISVAITGIAGLSDGRTATIVTAGFGDEEDEKGYVSRTTDGLLFAHSAMNDLQGELFYVSPIKVGTRWEGEDGRGAEVVAQENVNTPAGRFQNCFRINILDDGEMEAVVWLANNVGPVKMQEIGMVTVSDEAYSLSFSPDGGTLASGSESGIVRLWNLDTGTLENTLRGHITPVYSVSFSPDSRTLATVSQDAVLLQDVDTGSLKKAIQGRSSIVSFIPNGQLLATAVGNEVHLWDVDTGTLKSTFKHTDRIDSLSFSPDSRTLATASRNSVLLWDLDTGTEKNRLIPHTDGIDSVLFSPDGQLLTIVGDWTEGPWKRDEVRLWNLDTGILGNTLPLPNMGEGSIDSVSFSSDGRTLAVVKWLGTTESGAFWWGVYLLDVGTGTLKNARNIEESSTEDFFNTEGLFIEFNSNVRLSPDGRTLAVAVGENTVISLLDVDTGQLLRKFEVLTQEVIETITLEQFNVR